jgi:hypothetical protein
VPDGQRTGGKTAGVTVVMDAPAQVALRGFFYRARYRRQVCRYVVLKAGFANVAE